MKSGKQNLVWAVCALLFAVLACGNGNQQTEANKKVEEANRKLEDAKMLLAKNDERNRKLFSANVQTETELAEYKKAKNNEAEEIVADYEKVSAMLREISQIFDEVSRMNLNEKYKEYAKLKSDEFAKRAEAIAFRKGNAEAFIEIDDQKRMTKRFDENNTKADKLFNEAEEIRKKSKKLEDENRDLFVDLEK